MAAEVIPLDQAWRRLGDNPHFPVADHSDVEEVEVRCSNYRVLRWRWTQGRPAKATHWRPIVA